MKEAKETKEAKNDYADFNWDFLLAKKHNQHEALAESSFSS